MHKLRALSWTTFQELLRERFFIVGILVAIILVALSYLLGALSFYEQKRILFNMGTLGIELVSIGLGIFAGATLISKEIELRTCQIILTRPISRAFFLAGKWLGLVIFLLVTVLALSLIVLLLGGESFQRFSFWVISAEMFLKSVLLMTVVFLASLFLRPVLAALIGICIYLLGHAIEDIRFFIKRGAGEVPSIFEAFEKIVPRFDLFNWKSTYFLEKTFSNEQILLMLSHFICWTVLLLAVSLMAWRKKDIG